VEEKCKGEFIRAQVAPEGDHYTVYKGADKKWQSFPIR
jgi:hypothetical protein